MQTFAFLALLVLSACGDSRLHEACGADGCADEDVAALLQAPKKRMNISRERSQSREDAPHSKLQLREDPTAEPQGTVLTVKLGSELQASEVSKPAKKLEGGEQHRVAAHAPSSDAIVATSQDGEDEMHPFDKTMGIIIVCTLTFLCCFGSCLRCCTGFVIGDLITFIATLSITVWMFATGTMEALVNGDPMDPWCKAAAIWVFGLMTVTAINVACALCCAGAVASAATPAPEVRVLKAVPNQPAKIIS
eukprot:gnl/TRDRNA2_/TRDRNA2_190519_c0_seq1.p1 gnl/TRDRNA2_/TRDRNA2_190519_c0~~gnl/TRDRNA2_/TRDRNA2_190519_c0_seq1.p1  ORF type:complete len:249 (+),score=49.58 gnl/TRDRNA2_/TRDRNA2_190519_c0_seq1:55-801(+)